MALSPAVSLWVRSDLFTYGALSIPPHPRLSAHNIKKIVGYAKNKGKSGFPRLSYSVWKHIACNKLQLSEELSWVYFVTYDLVSESTGQQRLEWDKRFARCLSQQELDSVKSQVSVPTLRFVLFLFIQQFHKISLRASLVSGSDEWPSRTSSPDLEAGRSTPRGGKGLDEQAHMTFVLNNLNEIMELLVEPDSYSGGAGGSDVSLSIEAVEALGFMVEGSVDRNRNLKPLHEIALMQQVHQTSGYSKVNVETSRSPRGWKLVISRSFSFRNLQTWLRSHVGQNPFGISSCISQGRRLSWPLAGEDKEARADSKMGRIATNALLVPKDQVKGNKIIIMSQVCKQTVARSSGTLEGSSLKVHRCHYSQIYLLSPLRSVSIEKCRHSTIFLGAVETTVHLNQCDQVTVIAVCRRISVSSSNSCALHVLTPTRPLLYGNNEKITLGPYHTFYPKLEEHMAVVGLGIQPNVWDKPLCLGPGDLHDDHPPWELLNPDNIHLFSVPFEMKGETMCIPGGLPSNYQRALARRERTIESWKRLVKESVMTRDQRKSFQGLVESRFQEWLIESGRQRELDGLVIHTPSTKK